MEFGSIGWSGCCRCRLVLRPPCGRLLLSSVVVPLEVVGSVVVPLEVVGGAGPLLPRAPVSGANEVGAPLATGLPVIIMYTSRAASSELTLGFCLMYVSISS